MITYPELVKLSLPELKTLRDLVDKASEEVIEKERKKAAKEVEALAAKRGFTLKELVTGKKPGGRKKGPADPKYKHPTNPDLIWSGLGRKPGWLVEILDGGTDLEDLRI